jgi:cell division protein FtsB
MLTIRRIGALGALLLLAGCSSATDFLQLSGQTADTLPQDGSLADGVTSLEPGSPPELGQTVFVPPSVTGGVPTGTLVGRKVAQHRLELRTLQNAIALRNDQLQAARQSASQTSQRYHGTMAAINTRLQLGTTPGNPVLMSQWRAAQQELERLSQDVVEMNSLANDVASDSAMAAYLLDAARATYGLSGAIDEDHRQLAIVEDETNQTVVLIDRLLSELSEDVSRQTSYIGTERRNLSTTALAIQYGEILGDNLLVRTFSNGAQLNAAAAAAAEPSASQTPLVLIRFDRPGVDYERPLYDAVSAALERRPQAIFELVAVAAIAETPADTTLNLSQSRQNAADVLRSLTAMGLPAERLRLSSTSSIDIAANEIRIHVR